MISVILTAFERPYTLNEQIHAIKTQTIKPDEIIVWYNKGESEQAEIDDVTTIYCNRNFKFHSRFAFALSLQSQYIAIFDDDSIPGKQWFENCLDTVKTHPGILGSTGVLLQDNNYSNNQKVGWNVGPTHDVTEVDLVGHSWFFDKSYLKYMWYEEPISYENGEDIQFSALAYKYGNIKTYVPTHPKNNMELWGTLPTQGRQYGEDKQATYLKKGHLDIRNKIVKRYIEQGWQTVKQR